MDTSLRSIPGRRLRPITTLTIFLAAAIASAPRKASGVAPSPGHGITGEATTASAPAIPPSNLVVPAARPEAPPQPRLPVPLAFTVAGGVSLGAYEAGMLHYMVEIMKANPGLREPRLITGASAGSVNGLITILSACSPDEETVAPEDGLFWSTWIPLGFDQLWSRQHPGGPVCAFNRSWLLAAADRLRARWDAGLDARCDVVFGVSVTRVIPRTPPRPVGGLSIPRVEERFTLRIRGRGPGRPPSLRNYIDTTWPWEKVLLPEGADGEVPYESLRDLLLASSAFPVAYAPQPLSYCVIAPGGEAAPRCPPARAEEALFVDGGILDNTPLRLAARLAAGGLHDDGAGRLRWLDAPQLGGWTAPPRLLFVYVSPDAASYARPEEWRLDRGPPSVPRLVRQLVGGVLDTARAKNLSAILEEYPAIAGRIVLPLRHEPAAGSPMLAFLGFFEEEFRRYDFTLGMYEVRRMVEESVLPSMRRIDPAAQIVLPDELGSPGWKAVSCLRSLLDELPDAEERCSAPKFSGLRILAQSSLFRLWDDCATAAASRLGAEANTPDPHCLSAQRGEPPPLLPGVVSADRVEWRRRTGEEETVYTVRLLAALHFWWRDLGLPPGDGEEALAALRQRLGEVVGTLAAAQPSVADRVLVGTVGNVAVDDLTYQAPTSIGWLSFGRGLELGVSRAFPGRRFANLRFHAALELHDALAALSSDAAPVTPAILTGLELRPRRLSSPLLQTSFVLRGGWLLARVDGVGRHRCDLASRNPSSCTRPVVEAGLALSGFDSIRLQVLGESYPPIQARQRALWAVVPSLGIQLSF
jgi:hypothetical protein